MVIIETFFKCSVKFQFSKHVCLMLNQCYSTPVQDSSHQGDFPAVFMSLPITAGLFNTSQRCWWKVQCKSTSKKKKKNLQTTIPISTIAQWTATKLAPGRESLIGSINRMVKISQIRCLSGWKKWIDTLQPSSNSVAHCWEVLPLKCYSSPFNLPL